MKLTGWEYCRIVRRIGIVDGLMFNVSGKKDFLSDCSNSDIDWYLEGWRIGKRVMIGFILLIPVWITMLVKF